MYHRQRALTKNPFVFAVLFVILLISITYSSFVTSAEESTEERRNVTIIYDDSASMWYTFDPETNEQQPGDNWKFANYALQGLTSLLGEDDVLNVVRMSDELHVDEVNLSYGDRQQEINRIANWDESGWTPFETVHTSLSTMKESMSENPDDDYWFIILMDGAFNELDWNNVDDEEELEENYEMAYEAFLDFKEEVDERQVSFQSLFVTMEAFLTDDEVVQMARFKEEVWDKTLAGQHLKAETEQEIIHRLIDVAALITNRDPYSEETEMLFSPEVDGNEVILHSPYPLQRISVLQQRSGTEVSHQVNEINVDITDEPLSINGPFLIESPYDSYELRDTVFGAVTHVKHNGAGMVIPAGTYTLIFEDEINLDEYQFLAEPAIDFEIELQRVLSDDEVTEDETNFFHDSTMRLLVRFTDHGEEAVKNMNVNATIAGVDYDLVWNPELNAFQATFPMPTEPTIALVKAHIEGFYQGTREYRFSGVEPRSWELKANHSSLSSDINELTDAQPLSFTPFIDGEPITEEELRNLFHEVDVKVEDALGVNMVQEGGNILVFLEDGEVGDWEVTVKLSNPFEGTEATATATVSITEVPFVEKNSNILPYLFGGLLLVYILGILMKKRFAPQAHITAARSQMIYDRRHTIAERNVRLRSTFVKRWLVPFISEKKVVTGTLFKPASSKNTVLLAKESQHPDMVICGESLGDEAGKKDVLINLDETLSKEVGYVEETYTFYKK